MMGAEPGRTAHVVGGGLAGLSAAVRLAEAGERVVLYEGTRTPGGRCRSYRDGSLDLTIDNGNHLLLSGNRAALDFIDLVGGRSALSEGREPAFPFADLATGERWTVRPNLGRAPWWIFSPSRRVPGTRTRDYLAPLGILRSKPDRTIGEAMGCSGALYDRLWHPVLLAALNTEPSESAVGLAAPVLRETLGAGGKSCIPIVATGGLSAAFVEPALAYLAKRGAELKLGARLRELAVDRGRIAALRFSSEDVPIGPDDAVVLAVPPWAAQELVPELEAPTEFRGIVNAHFRIEPPPGVPLVLGLVGGLSEWLFAYPDRLSVTISGADRLFDTPREDLASRIWAEIARVAGLPPALPRWQIVKERRATFAATPAEALKRPKTLTRYPNLMLAGDWTDTGLPATIEGAIRSGRMAASLLRAGNAQRAPALPKAAA